MDRDSTGTIIRTLRGKLGMTQAELADRICVSSKTVSKWETGRGFPDVSMLEPIGRALHISVPELLCGQKVINKNRSSDMLKSRFYVCPACGNVVFSRGDAVLSCCGIRLHALRAEEADPRHCMDIRKSEDEIFVSSEHPMSREHFLAFAAYMTTDRCEIKVLYPEGNPEARFFYRGRGWLFFYCSRHGLFRQGTGNLSL